MPTFITRQFEICDFPEARPFIEFILETGRAVLLFDGLDEVRREGGQRAAVITGLRDFSHKYAEAQILLTCRVAATDYLFEDFTYLEIADFNDAQMETYARKWFHRDPEKAEQFLAELGKEENRGVRDLGRSPLLLSLICLAFDETLGIPRRRVELYEEALDALLKRWDSSRKIRRDEIYEKLSLGRKRQMFARLAAKHFEKGEIFFPKMQLAEEIADYLKNLPPADAADVPDGDAVLQAVEAQHGILVTRARGICSFAHLTFQEYYTARYIAENASRGTLPGLMRHLGDPRWNEVFLLTASLLDEAGDFFAAMQNALTDMLRGDETLWAMAQHADRKAAAVHGYQPGAVRAVYWYDNLARARTLARARARALALDLDPDLARTLDLDRVLGRDLDLALDLVSRPPRAPQDAEILFLDLHIIYLIRFAEIFARGSKRTVRKHRPKLAAYCEVLQTRFASILHPALTAHFNRLPSRWAFKAAWKDFSNRLRALAVAHHDIGHRWKLTLKQYQLAEQYLAGNQLLLECLEVAYVRDRQAILERVLAVPEAGE